MFYCREEELHAMNRRYDKGRFECVVIYGRRRIGKTALINEFCKGKPTVYFSALNASAQENLEALSKAIYSCNHPDSFSFPSYRSYADALNKISSMSVHKRMVFVIDEYPYLAKAEKSFSSRLQHMIDQEWQDGQLYLILCGSSMSFMEYQVLGYESPLYGRRTAQFKIQALTYREITAFHPRLPAPEQALLYGITGGIPHYINKLDMETDLDEALIENLFDTSSYLFEEPGNLLKQELREPAISAGRMRQAYEQAVKRYYPDYMGLVFEKMCREYLLRYAENLPFPLSDVGQWRGTDAKFRKEIQIDIVGTPIEGNEFLIGSCKYQNEKIGMDELELIRSYASVFRKNGRFHYYIFSREGFTPTLMEAADRGEVTLLTLGDLYK